MMSGINDGAVKNYCIFGDESADRRTACPGASRERFITQSDCVGIGIHLSRVDNVPRMSLLIAVSNRRCGRIRSLNLIFVVAAARKSARFYYVT